MKRRAEQKEQTRERLLAAAREVFEEHGFEEANLRVIARQAGVVPGTIFVHFRDKRDLLHAALFEDLAAALRQALAQPEGESLEAWLAGLTDGMFAYYETRPKLSRVLLQESLLADPPWAQRFAGQFAEAHAAIVRRAEASRERGEVRADADLALFAAAFLSFYLFGLVSWAQRTHPAPRELVRRLTAQHLEALRPSRAQGGTRGTPYDHLSQPQG